MQNPRSLHYEKYAIASVYSLLGVMALFFLDVGVIFAHRPPVFVQGEGQECRCVLGVVFPTVIASAYDSDGNLVDPTGTDHYGTGAWFKHWQDDPAGWASFLDEDNLWIKTKCGAQPDAENPVDPVEDPEEAWALETTPSDGWWEGEEYDNWTEEFPDPTQEHQSFYPGADVHCPCQILVKWIGTDGKSGVYYGLCPKLWRWLVPGSGVDGIAANVLPGESVDITVRMICGDCVLERTDTATMSSAP